MAQIERLDERIVYFPYTPTQASSSASSEKSLVDESLHETVANFDATSPSFIFPLELGAMVFQFLPDLDSVASLALTCNSYHAAYTIGEKQTLVAMLRRQLADANLEVADVIDAIYAREVDSKIADVMVKINEGTSDVDSPEENERRVKAASQARDKIVNDVVQPLYESGVKRDIKLATLSLSQLRKLAVLHKHISYLVDGFVRRMTSHDVMTGKPQEPAKDLRPAELRRLYVPFYKWEIWSALFGPVRKSTAEHEEVLHHVANRQQLDLFWKCFELWELDSMIMVKRHADLCWTRVFKTVRERLEEFKGPVDPKAFANYGWRNGDPNDFTAYGPSLLYKSLVCPDAKGLTAIVANHIETNIDVRHLKHRLNFRFRREPTRYLMTSNEPPGWLWIFRHRLALMMNPTNPRYGLVTWCGRHHLHQFGYVFWDEERLTKWGVINNNIYWAGTPGRLRNKATFSIAGALYANEWYDDMI